MSPDHLELSRAYNALRPLLLDGEISNTPTGYVLFVQRAGDGALLGINAGPEMGLFGVGFYEGHNFDGETVSEACDIHALYHLAESFARGVLFAG